MKFLPCGIAIALAASLALAACGGTSTLTTTKATEDIVFGDCSSFRRYASDYLDEMLAFAESSALKARRLEYGCVDGAPLRTLHLKELDFGKVTKGVTPRPDAPPAAGKGPRARPAAEIQGDDRPARADQGLGTTRGARARRPTARRRAGRDLDGRDPQSDPGGINLAAASPSRIDATARRWARRMNDGLRGVEILVLGVGRGAVH